jgi:hypothetical protein
VDVTLIVDLTAGKVPEQGKNIPCESKKEKAQ